MVFTRKNFYLIIASVVLIILGFVLMSGGASSDGISFNEEIFNTRRTIVAPIVSLAGFLLMIYAIMTKPKRISKKEQKEE